MIHKHPIGGWVTHMNTLSEGKACPHCQMTPGEYKASQQAQEKADDEREARVIARGILLARQEGQKECPLCGIPIQVIEADIHIRGCFEINSKAEQVRLNTLLKRSYEAVMCIDFPQEEPNKFHLLARDLMKEIDSVINITGARNVHGPLICLRCYQDFSYGGLIGQITALENQVIDFMLNEAGKKCTHDQAKFWKGYFQGGDGQTKEVGWGTLETEGA